MNFCMLEIESSLLGKIKDRLTYQCKLHYPTDITIIRLAMPPEFYHQIFYTGIIFSYHMEEQRSNG